MPTRKLALIFSLTILVALVSSALVGWSVPSGARAAAKTSCSGKLVFHEKMYYSGDKPIGELNLYWNGKTKRNCAILYRLGRLRGKKGYTEVWLYRCEKGVKDGEDCGDNLDSKFDGDEYRYHAGPITIKAANRCVSAGGRIIMGNGAFVWVTTDPGSGIQAGFCN